VVVSGSDTWIDRVTALDRLVDKHALFAEFGAIEDCFEKLEQRVRKRYGKSTSRRTCGRQRSSSLIGQEASRLSCTSRRAVRSGRGGCACHEAKSWNPGDPHPRLREPATNQPPAVLIPDVYVLMNFHPG
jgi:hypothetical protein